MHYTEPDSEAGPVVTIVIVNYNAGDRLRRCLEHIAAQSFRVFDVIVVDNASSDRSIAAARAAGVEFRLLEPRANIGFAAANNLAAKVARSEWLAFLNPDAYAEPDWLEKAMSASTQYPWADAFGSLQLDDVSPNRIDGAGDSCSVWGVFFRGFHGWTVDAAPEDSECFAPCAAAAFYRRSRFLDLGGFDERFFCYGEDVDLGFRLLLSGGRAIQLCAAQVRHEGSGLTGRNSAFSIYYGHRNRIWLFYKNTPRSLYWATMPLRLAADVLLGVRAILSGNAKPYLEALLDGYGRLPSFDEDRRRWALTARSDKVGRRMVWSPLSVIRRQGKNWPVQPDDRSK